MIVTPGLTWKINLTFHSGRWVSIAGAVLRMMFDQLAIKLFLQQESQQKINVADEMSFSQALRVSYPYNLIHPLVDISVILPFDLGLEKIGIEQRLLCNV